MGRAARIRHHRRWKQHGAPHAAAERPEPVRHPPGAAEHANRGRRDEPVELARGRDRAVPRAAPAQEARAGRGGAAPAAAPLAGRGGRAVTRVAVAVETADMPVHEILSRDLRDRRAVARYAGLTGSPDESGSRRREKGLARSGNARVRRGMIQLAWRFLLHQKDSALARWYRARTADARAGHVRDADRGAGAEAPGRAVAAGDHGQGNGGPRPAAGVTGRIGQPHGKRFRRSATPPGRAADDGPRWR